MTLDYKARDEELQTKRLSKLPQLHKVEGFEEGLQAIVIDHIVSEEDHKKKADLIIENAKKEAAALLDGAKVEARQLKKVTEEAAQMQGYDEGIRKGDQKIQQLKDDLVEQQKQSEEEYQGILKGISGQVTDLLVSLITKLTGIFVENKTDIILHLVEKALMNNDSKDDYTIRVSREDEDVISSKKEYIERIIGRDIQIMMDPLLVKNQCLIETESKLIDCSLDVQLNSLITDLKLLSSPPR
jgi:flagellar assembly protein FliH